MVGFLRYDASIVSGSDCPDPDSGIGKILNQCHPAVLPLVVGSGPLTDRLCLRDSGTEFAERRPVDDVKRGAKPQGGTAAGGTLLAPRSGKSRRHSPGAAQRKRAEGKKQSAAEKEPSATALQREREREKKAISADYVW